MKNHRGYCSHVFTMVEMLAVIAVVLIITGFMIAGYMAATNKASEHKTKAVIKKIEMALEAYKGDWGCYPPQPALDPMYMAYEDSVTGKLKRASTGNKWTLVDYLSDIESMKSSGEFIEEYWSFGIDSDGGPKDKSSDVVPVMHGKSLNDGWEQPLLYRCPGVFNPGSYDLGSVGADGWCGDARVCNEKWDVVGGGTTGPDGEDPLNTNVIIVPKALFDEKGVGANTPYSPFGPMGNQTFMGALKGYYGDLREKQCRYFGKFDDICNFTRDE